MADQKLAFKPVTPARWDDFVTVFGQNGACSGCWCMYWRKPRGEWNKGTKELNRTDIKAVVDNGHIPGLLAYVDGIPAGWVSVAPRGEFPTLDRSRVLFQVDDKPVWSIVCFFVHRKFRRAGLMRPLIDAAVDYARSQGAAIVEAYPMDPGRKVGSTDIYMGVITTFLEAGFIEVARRSKTHPVLRKYPD
jgi:GNAT superfamily N-acetyltransferase